MLPSIGNIGMGYVSNLAKVFCTQQSVKRRPKKEVEEAEGLKKTTTLELDEEDDARFGKDAEEGGLWC